ncbi:MAG TPA: hypothetical protein VK430_01410 [Xanthobacteraceae bacterium]|nr:hypothetical protein [Xanthobacteraceae bacterium]
MLARQIAIGFGIAVIFPLLVYYGVATIYPPPERPGVIAAVLMPPNPTPEERQEYREKERERQQKQKEQEEAYKAAAKDFARHLIVIAAPLGYAAILIGAFLPLYAIGTGLILGGISTVGHGYFAYWQYLDDRVRFVSLLVGFLVLLFVGYYRIAGPNTRAGSP